MYLSFKRRLWLKGNILITPFSAFVTKENYNIDHSFRLKFLPTPFNFFWVLTNHYVISTNDTYGKKSA